MNPTGTRNLIAAALVSVLASTSAFGEGLPTTGTVQSPIGSLEIKNGYPTDTTVTALYDALDFQRAVQAYLWALPYVAMGRGRASSAASSARRNSITSITSTSRTNWAF
jgi:hypothetical protein